MCKNVLKNKEVKYKVKVHSTLIAELGCVNYKFYSRQAVASKWFIMKQTTLTNSRITAMYNLLELCGLLMTYTIYGKIHNERKMVVTEDDDGRRIITDPYHNDNFQRKLSYINNTFFSKDTPTTDWRRISKAKISPERIVAFYKLIEQKEN